MVGEEGKTSVNFTVSALPHRMTLALDAKDGTFTSASAKALVDILSRLVFVTEQRDEEE